jgi:AmmeMemoRadiSam system protein B
MRAVHQHARIRPAAVAGSFYPREAGKLRSAVGGYLRAAPAHALPAVPKAWIVPHAGYVYSGPVAAVAYALLQAQGRGVRRVVLIGPSHRVPLDGIAVPEADAFETPLGTVSIDDEMKAALARRGDVVESDRPHALEHSLEVQLPFLQAILADFTLLPLVTGSASPQYVASVLEEVWGGPETVVIVSSDLSHYHRYEIAQMIDGETSDAIRRCATDLSSEQACGAVGINGFLHVACARGLMVTEIARCNSGDTAGDRTRVVGYGAFAIHESAQA